MANNCGEDLVICDEYIFVLGGLPDICDHLSLNGNQIESVAAQGQFSPIGWFGHDRRLHMAVLNLAICEGQKAVMQTGESGHVCQVPNYDRGECAGLDPKARGAALQNNDGTGLVVRNGPVDPDSLGKNLDM